MIDILMATYNGETYLRAQLDSILNQTCQEWQLIIRDDCSNDRTVEIIKEYQQFRPNQIQLIQAEQPSGSAQNNFFQLIKHSKAEYVMFADQDDVWMNWKVEKTLDKMQQMEQENGKEKPLLVHTDLAVVDENLKIMNYSLFAMQNMNAKRDSLNHLIVQNCVTGCTMMANRALLNLITEIPKNSIMHDMWLALIASAFGKIGFIKKSTMLYRQHGSNANGAKNVKSLKYFLWKLTGAKEIHQGLVAQYRQTEEFLKIYQTKLNSEQQQMLKIYAEFEQKTIFQKLFYLKKYQLWKKGFVRKVGQLLM